MKTVIITAVCVMLLASSLHAIDEKKIVDMTYPFSAEIGRASCRERV